MSKIDILSRGHVAVISGGAAGIGLAAANNYARRGMSVVILDWNETAVGEAVKKLESIPGVGKVRGIKVDVSNVADVVAMRDRVLAEFPEIHVLMANHAIRDTIKAFEDEPLEEVHGRWTKVVSVNLNGIILLNQAFAPTMSKQKTPSVIMNTGSKTGIDNRPQKPAYSTAKAGLKAYTEQLAHQLRNTPGCQCVAHLFLPGFVWTGWNPAIREKPAGAWMPDRVIDYMITEVFEKDLFYAICPDDEVSPLEDKVDMGWSLNDLPEGRPALSRWHPDWAPRYQAYLEQRRREAESGSAA